MVGRNGFDGFTNKDEQFKEICNLHWFVTARALGLVGFHLITGRTLRLVRFHLTSKEHPTQMPRLVDSDFICCADFDLVRSHGGDH